jgi:histidinol-phosphate aminotransferase
MAGYTPGEQPGGTDYLKLNTNENPYPPSPRVLEAVRRALTGDFFRKYPDPLGTNFRQTAARVLDVDPDGILIGNGSDDILTIVTRAFVPDGGIVAAPNPGYLLYRTLAELQNASFRAIPYTPEWGLPDPWPLQGANLTLVANPNSPSGTTVPIAALARLNDQAGPLVIDEAYVDFTGENALSLARLPNVIVTRTLSKSYSLAGIRFGYAVAQPALICELVKVKDSYNCDALSLVAATAALQDQEYLRGIRDRILATRQRLAVGLTLLGFAVTPSQANFVWCKKDGGGSKSIYEELKRRRILVRYLEYSGYGEGMRITVGSDADCDRLLAELGQIV